MVNILKNYKKGSPQGQRWKIMKYFKNVESFKNLKEQYKKLIKVNHPDAGGNNETMQEINSEYDILFAEGNNKTDIPMEDLNEGIKD